VGLLQWLVCACAFALAFMQPAVPVLGFAAVPGDVLYALLIAFFAVALAAGRARVVGDRAHLFIALYLAALLVSFLASSDPQSTPAKLATQLYLLSMPVLLLSLVRSEDDLRRVVLAWLAGTAVVVLVGGASLLLFAFDPASPWLDPVRYHFGTLPPGSYPRFQLTFLNANMACNYLTVSLALVLAAGRLSWIGPRAGWSLVTGIAIAAMTTISPGLGGILLMGALWFWLTRGEQRLGRLVLSLGALAALLFVVAMAVTPIVHPTAPFLIRVPLLDLTLAPSGRLMVWMEAAGNILERPVSGRGIGAETVATRYRDPSGGLQRLTDAHNMFLNIAVQSGLLGLAALIALILHIAGRLRPLRLPPRGAGVVRVAVGLGLLNGLVYQGLGGSFEDARHLWFAFGLLLASDRIERGARAEPGTG
jgi:O-antigen ligase